jgi:hypothetical protein
MNYFEIRRVIISFEFAFISGSRLNSFQLNPSFERRRPKSPHLSIQEADAAICGPVRLGAGVGVVSYG